MKTRASTKPALVRSGGFDRAGGIAYGVIGAPHSLVDRAEALNPDSAE